MRADEETWDHPGRWRKDAGMIGRHRGGDAFPEVSELAGGYEHRGRSGSAGWSKAERQVATMATPKAAVYRNAYQENEPARPDDKSAVRGDVGVT